MPYQVRSAERHEAYLVIMHGDDFGQRFPISRSLVVGRSKRADITIEDSRVSRRHARISRSVRGEFALQDLGSHNGTSVNGEAIRRRKLRHGDRIQLGEITCLKFVLQDDLEHQLEETQKMEAVGSLAGGIAHDFNNLLTVIIGGIEYLESGWHKEPALPADEITDTLAAVSRASARAKDLTRQLLGFARRGKFEEQPVNIARCVEEAVDFARHTFDRLIEIHSSTEDDLWVRGDRSQIQQVLLNLCINSRDAMPNGGSLTIAARRLNLAQEDERNTLPSELGSMLSYPEPDPTVDTDTRSRTELPQRMYIEVTVQDTGHGMDKETRKHAFEPFFTTKESGSGMGLAMVYGITQRHGGFVSLKSKPNAGTTARVWLPGLAAGSAELERPSMKMPAISPDGAVILLVDDEDGIRTMARRFLSKEGYAVLEACDGQDAIEVYRKNREKISLVVLDLLMPHMGGAEAFSELLAVDDTVRVLVSSGYDDNQAKEVMSRGAVGFLSKPYTRVQLLRAVAEALIGDEGDGETDPPDWNESDTGK